MAIGVRGSDRDASCAPLALATPPGYCWRSNYLAQSFILSFFFYGYGLGLYGRLGPAAAAGVGIVVYAMQAVFSRDVAEAV